MPLDGASGGILIVWKCNLFSTTTLYHNNYAISLEFCSAHNNTKWTLTCIYTPGTPEGKILFLEWFKNNPINNEDNHIILGDFNLIRKIEDRNKPGGDISNMFRFNAAISQLGINEIALQGRRYTWSNKQPNPLLEKLVFTFANWAISYPNTTVHAMEMIPFDHCPYVINISTTIPKSNVFIFEHYWLKDSDFQQVLSQSWSNPSEHSDSAKLLTAKFKTLRKNIKAWQSSIRNLKKTVTNVREVLLLLEVMSETRDLSLEEWNFKKILEDHLLNLLENQRIYWR
jgi:hypothetical protein